MAAALVIGLVIDAIQKIELADREGRIWELVHETSRTLGCEVLRISWHRAGRPAPGGLSRRARPARCAKTRARGPKGRRQQRDPLTYLTTIICVRLPPL